MTLPTPFTTVPPFVTVVNFTDIIQNLGFIELYGATVHDGSNKIYILTSNSSMFSFEEFTKIGPGSAGTVLNNVNFPITFGNFFDILGDALITIPVDIIGGSNNSYTTTVTLTLTEPSGDTVLGTATAVLVGGNAPSPAFQMMTFTIEDLDFRINVGDIITLKVHAASAGGGSPETYVIHDPANRTSIGNINSQMKVQLPVKVDR